jgi:undecaprenyl-diphosphatase
MSLVEFLQAAFLGLLEGLTEFIPVSSTGHLILLVDLLGIELPPGKVFEIVIQLGAILAICVVYARKLTGVVFGLGRDPAARRFVIAILLAFLPSMLVGALAHGFIKSVLFSPYVVSVSLILGGIAIIAIERNVPTPKHDKVENFSTLLALKIGLFQVISMIPGVSRSGATIMGALLMGVERRAAAEFSFFLAIPTMLAATSYDLYQNWSILSVDDGGVIAVGFIAAFLAALLVVRTLLAFVSRHGFQPFAWYRIGLGGVMLAVLYLI